MVVLLTNGGCCYCLRHLLPEAATTWLSNHRGKIRTLNHWGRMSNVMMYWGPLKVTKERMEVKPQDSGK